MGKANTRIVFFQENPAYGLCEYYFSVLVEGVARAGFDSVLFCPKDEACDRLTREASSCAKTVRYPSGISTMKLARLMLSERPGLIHFNDPCVKAMLASRIAGVKKRILTFHTPAQPFNYNIKGRITRYFAFKGGVEVVVTSQEQKIQLLKRYAFNPEKVHVVNYGLDRTRLSCNEPRENIRREFGITPEEVVVGNVAMLRPQKNHALLLEAFKAAKGGAVRKTKLLIVGGGELKASLIRRAGDMGLSQDVIFAGYRKDVPRLLKAMDIFTMSSDYEGQCYAVLEAMAMGLPVIATRVGGIADAIKEEETGIIVPCNDRKALAGAMKELIEDPAMRSRMGSLAAKAAEGSYFMEKMISDTIDIYKRLS